MKAKKIFSDKLIGYVYFSLNYDSKLSNKSNFVTQLISDLHETTIGFAGFKSKKYLKQSLQFQIFDNKEYKKLPHYHFNQQTIFEIIKNTLTKCHQELPARPTRIFLFPSFNAFVKNKMGGISGLSPWKNVILVYINPTVKNWEIALKDTIAHEYNHSVIYNFHKWETLLDSIIFEGLAEHFKEKVIGGGKAPWTQAISPKACKKYFSQLKERLNSKSHRFYRDIFFGSEEFPLWLGYSLGYQIVKSFLDRNQGKRWLDIVKIKPKGILKNSDFWSS